EHLHKFAYVDYARLKQVLINLLSNAVKFTENGQIELTVQFSALSEKTGEFFFSIKDTGIGMSHKQQNSIFKAFSQGDTSISKKFGGTGLGLIISQRIVQKMGSEIQFESERNKGSTFYFQLKANYKRTQEFENDSINEFNEESEPIKGVNHINHKVTNDTPTFLIVDDVETSRFLLSEYLKEFEGDIKILEAVNGKQAVEIIKREKPDLVLMDLFMPVLDGLKATKIIRDFEEKHQLKRTIIFALTATATKVQEQECYNMGMDAYLTKPLKKVQLYEKIHQFWKPKKSHGTSGADQALDISNDHELATLLNSLKEMLIKNDLSAIDFLENNERELESLGDADSLKKLKNQIINLKYQEALYDLNELIEASLKRQK
ncbi:MAG: ATP-binding protein, partial [Thermotogota bacterium]